MTDFRCPMCGVVINLSEAPGIKCPYDGTLMQPILKTESQTLTEGKRVHILND